MASFSSPVRTLPANLFLFIFDSVGWHHLVPQCGHYTCHLILFIFEAVEHIRTSTGSQLSCLDPFFLMSVEVLEGVEEHRLPHKWRRFFVSLLRGIMHNKIDYYAHKVHTYKEYQQCMSPRRNWDSPTSSLASECAPPPGSKGGGGRPHSRAGEGWGSPNSNDWRKSLALCLYSVTTRIIYNTVEQE